MKEKRKRRDKSEVAHWETVAALYEGPKTSLRMMENSRTLTAAEKRKLFGKARTKAISIRIPENDLQALREIAQRNDRKYQQLIIIAIEQYLNQFMYKHK